MHDTVISRYIGRVKDPEDGYPPFVEIHARSPKEALYVFEQYCQGNSFIPIGLHESRFEEGEEVPSKVGYREFDVGERPGRCRRENLMTVSETKKPQDTGSISKPVVQLVCPLCSTPVMADPNDSNKALCLSCKKRMPMDLAVPRQVDTMDLAAGSVVDAEIEAESEAAQSVKTETLPRNTTKEAAKGKNSAIAAKIKDGRVLQVVFAVLVVVDLILLAITAFTGNGELWYVSVGGAAVLALAIIIAMSRKIGNLRREANPSKTAETKQ